MNSVSDALGPISEMLTWIGLVPGLLLLFASALIRHFSPHWQVSDGVVYSSGDKLGYRWYDASFDIHEAPAPPHAAAQLVPGSDVVIYYHPRHPGEWRLSEPERPGGVAFALGWVFTGVGLLALLTGFILPLL